MVKTSVLVCKNSTRVEAVQFEKSKQPTNSWNIERLLERHQQCREGWKATSHDPTIIKGHCQVFERHAKAW